jgi:hypothetical protein
MQSMSKKEKEGSVQGWSQVRANDEHYNYATDSGA